MALIDKLLIGLGFDYDPKEMDQFKKDVDKTVGTVKALAKVAALAATAVTGLTIASTRASDEQGKLAGEIDENVENIDALQFALRRAGGSADGMTTSLQQLSIRASEASRGVGSGVEAFGLLGISVSDVRGQLKPTSDLLLEVSQRFQGLSSAKQIELADKLGLRDSIRLLQQGPVAIRELTAEAEALGVTTAEDAAISADFQDSLTDIWQITKQLSRTISRSLAPLLESINDSVTEWWKQNRQIIEQKFPEWVEKVTVGLKVLSLALAAILAVRIVTHLVTLIGLMKGLTAATLAANAAAFLLPALIAASAAALLLLVEDAKVFFEGGESFIGDMIKKFPQWRTEITAVAAVFATIADLTAMVFDGWSKIFDLFDKFSLDNIKEVISNLPGFAMDATGLSEVGGGGIIPEGVGAIQKFLESQTFQFDPSRIGGSSSTTTVDRIDIIIQGGIDSAETVANAVYNVFQQTSQDLNSAVDQ